MAKIDHLLSQVFRRFFGMRGTVVVDFFRFRDTVGEMVEGNAGEVWDMLGSWLLRKEILFAVTFRSAACSRCSRWMDSEVLVGMRL
jgi:hypothetical protein